MRTGSELEPCCSASIFTFMNQLNLRPWMFFALNFMYAYNFFCNYFAQSFHSTAKFMTHFVNFFSLYHQNFNMSCFPKILVNFIPFQSFVLVFIQWMGALCSSKCIKSRHYKRISYLVPPLNMLPLTDPFSDGFPLLPVESSSKLPLMCSII